MSAGLVFWFTGLSGAGKSTLAERVAPILAERGRSTLILDGDALRAVLSPDLGFSAADILANNRRVAEHCADRRAEADALLVPIIAPLAEGRRLARQRLAPGFFEIWISAGLATVTARDPKGLYARAAMGEITDMIGYSPTAPYQPPTAPDLTIDTANLPPERCAERLVGFIMERLADSVG